ncbi:hypothetical protein P12x_002760 [Tundrisphaera lichenicola]|uniref:hypothetical protein n=1 Tax=Tundrisphaera lichenicola TaxID=2029860 RepID=UPI003EBA7B5B
MRLRAAGSLVAVAAVAWVMAPGTASACHKCHRNPCVLAPAPAPTVQCVTEMVPYTTYKNVTRTAFRPVTETIMVKKATTTFVERQRVVCKPVFDTTFVQRTVEICRPVHETSYVNQQYTVCRPVSTTQQVTEYQYQPSTRMVSVPVVSKGCGHCGKPKIACGCVTVAQTCYTPVPVVRDVVVTRMVSEVQTRQVPVTHTRMVRETKVENVPVRHCRMVQEVVTDRIPVTTFHCEPKQITRQVPYPVCETVAVTCYRPVTRMVPVVYAAPAPAPSLQAAPAPSGQAAAPSKQG